jgi:hypothetical protein
MTNSQAPWPNRAMGAMGAMALLLQSGLCLVLG